MLVSKTAVYSLFSCLAAMLFLCSCSNSGNTAGSKADTITITQTVQPQAYVKLAIMYRADSSKVIDSLPVTGKMSVKDVMEAASKQSKLTFETKPGQHGMIDAIDGFHTNGTKQYWWLCVNDTCASAGFEDQQATPGSTIAWHYVTDGKQPCKNCSYNN